MVMPVESDGGINDMFPAYKWDSKAYNEKCY